MTGTDDLLDEIARALDDGREPDTGELRARFPGRPEVVERLVSAARSYRVSLALHAREGAREGLGRGEDLQGRRLGDFEVGPLLAVGGMGAVFEARQLSLGRRRVALKVLSGWAARDVARARFEREALLLSGLHHPSLSEVYGFGQEGGLFFLAMRLVDGSDLATLQGRALEEGRALPPRRVVRWAIDVAEALEVVHRAGLVHRDVKPSNVVIESAEAGPADEGRAVLVDFGLVREVSAEAVTRTGLSAATPGYAAPEQLTGCEVDASADVFALGATLHDLLAGREPGVRRQASAGLEPLHELAPGVDRDLAAVVAKATRLEPGQRYADASGLLADLRAWSEGRAVAARRDTLLEGLTRWLRRNPGRVVRGAALGLLLLAAAGGVAFARGVAVELAGARAAYRRGDPLEFARSVRAVPALAVRLGLTGELRRAAGEVREPEAPGPYLEVLAGLEQNDPLAALFATVTHLREQGLAGEPLLVAFLRAALLDETEEASSSDLGHAAIAFTARLFHERPDLSAADVRASRELRGALTELLARPELARQDRLRALTALSGCGTPAELPSLWAWSLEQPAGSEDQRMGLVCMERIARRTLACGGAEAIDYEALWPPLASFGRRALEEFETPTERERLFHLTAANATLDLAKALAAARRSTGLEPFAVEELLPSWGEFLDREWVPWHVGPLLRAAAGEPGLMERLPAMAGIERLDPRTWGWIAAVSGDPNGERVARAFWAQRPWRAGGQKDLLLEQGLASGRAFLRGERTETFPDSDTLLQTEPRARTFETLEFERLGGPDETRARWDFAAVPPTIAGLATGGVAHACPPAIDERGRPYLRQNRFGVSEVRLRFEVRELPAQGSWTLELQHLSGMRAYLPFGGEVYLEVSFDGRVLSGAHPVYPRPPYADHFELPARLLTPGTHEVVIRNHPLTSTTYRLVQVSVGPLE